MIRARGLFTVRRRCSSLPRSWGIIQATQALSRKINRLPHYTLTAPAIDESKSVIVELLQTALTKTGY